MLWKALLKHWQNKGQSLFVQILDAKPNWTSKKTYSNTLLLRSLIITFFLIIFFYFDQAGFLLVVYEWVAKKALNITPFAPEVAPSGFFWYRLFTSDWIKKSRKYRKNNEFEIFQSPDFHKIYGISWLLSGNFRAFPGFFPLDEVFFLGIGCPDKKPPLL